MKLSSKYQTPSTVAGKGDNKLNTNIMLPVSNHIYKWIQVTSCFDKNVLNFSLKNNHKTFFK